MSHSFLYEGDPDVPEGMTLSDYHPVRDARMRARSACVELCEAIESREPIWISRAEREYVIAMLELACALS